MVYSIKANRTNRKCSHHGPPYHLKEQILKTLHLSPFPCVLLLSKMCYQKRCHDYLPFVVKLVFTQEEPSMCSLHFKLSKILEPFVHFCLSQIFLSLRILTFSFTLHLHHFYLPYNISFYLFFLRLCWLACLGRMANPCTCAKALSCG